MGMRAITRALTALRDLYFDRVSQIKMPAWSRGRVALVGDAAFCVSLMAGQGSALSMAAAYVLAGELAKAGDGTAKRSKPMRPFCTPLLFRSRGPSVSPRHSPRRTGFGLFLRNQIIRACAVPGLAKLMFGRDITDRLPLPDSLWPALARAAA